MHKPTPSELKDFLTRRTEKIIGEKELKAALLSGRQLTIKFGVDVTSPDIHLGHTVNLLSMRQLQEWGHKVVFLIGGFTTKIGDPTGRTETRKEISDKEIAANAKKYIDQVGKVLLTSPKVFAVRNNADWFGKMPAGDLVRLLANVTHAQLIERDMFQARLAANKEIRMHEMIYPIIQGYDSAMLKDDLTIVGNDQLFNEMMGRFFQDRMGQKPQAIITNSILVGTDGAQKMGKSLGNYIALADTPADKYGKIMSIPDWQILDYLLLATTIDTREILSIVRPYGITRITNSKGKETLAIIEDVGSGRLLESTYRFANPWGVNAILDRESLTQSDKNPRDLKMLLAHKIVSMYDGSAAANKAEAAFIGQFQKNEIPSDIPAHKLTKKIGLLDLLIHHKLISSKSEGRRLIEQSGIRLNDAVVTDINLELAPKTQAIIQIGKRKFLKVD